MSKPPSERGVSEARAAETGVWVVTDGRPGNENPARALARALEGHGFAPAALRRAVPRGWAARLPAVLWRAIPARAGGWPFSAYENPDALAGPWPGLVISAGRRAAPAAAAMRALSGGATRAVQILDPRMGAGAFDALVLPEHDGRAGAGIVTTLGSLSAVTPEAARAAAGPWEARLAHLPRPRLAALIGGPSGSNRWGEAEGRAALAALGAARAAGWGLMVTPSRRTPPGLAAQMRDAAPEAFVWDGTGDNPYPGILGLADAALVTADSVNMASEAASAGLPVNVLPVAGLAPKLARFHAGLAARGASRDWSGAPQVWEVEALDEAGRVAASLAPSLAPRLRGG
ncbi:MAG: mitochondrial fission ELM1 family protein [Pseudomonadota bacterium]|nr:mitochondrial fission ELM1 family protein [Pseudomonadota bacterium]